MWSVEVTEYLVGASSVFPLCGSQESNLGSQAKWLVFTFQAIDFTHSSCNFQ